ncbi:hypothetical protein [Ornithinibacillus californiensis]|uniref:hypothetical protein n=1 Tax=Ornithinibacillus californiensis TaxID=161536 RepID=UPI00064DBC5B|nr:hypothetical protein [Ornithinibacillus californiensis]
MLKDKKTNSDTSPNKSDSKFKLMDLKELKSLDKNDSTAFVCDVNTGICGPVKQEKEGKL